MMMYVYAKQYLPYTVGGWEQQPLIFMGSVPQIKSK
jgi:hypothetical protein